MKNRPNILLILNDDMGYSDLGCYGGEIDTPNLDALAKNGLRFTQFYNTARCSPSRASLLTGLHPHQCGIGVLTDDDGPEGYPGDLNHRCVTMAEVLKGSGYRTYMSGKWHMSHDFADLSDSWPTRRGFEEFYGTIAGAGSYYLPNTLTRGETNIEHEARENPDFYYTDAISDQAVRYVHDHAAQQDTGPFFLYTAYTSPHWPLHAKEEDIAPYRGRFDAGWDVLRERRLERMREMGVLESDWALTGRDPGVPAWESISDKTWEARRMEVYAAQITAMDRGIGRIVKALEDTGELENTLIMFLADNGGCAEELSVSWKEPLVDGLIAQEITRDGRDVRFGNTQEILPGPEDTYVSYGVPWANLSNTPFRMYKHWIHEGGIATPFIAHWPAGLRAEAGGFEREPAALPDVMATVLDVTGAAYPAEFNGNEIYPPEGQSFLDTLQGTVRTRKPLFWEHEGNAGVREGRWKLVRNFENCPSAVPGYCSGEDRGAWELYDMERDRSECRNLADENPEIVRRLSAEYDRWAERCGVIDREKILEVYRTRGDAGGTARIGQDEN